MEICYIEAGVLEKMLARAESLSTRVDRLYERNRYKESGEWLGNQDICLRPDISPRTLQTPRDTGRLVLTRLQRKFYYEPEDVEKLMTYIGIRCKEEVVRRRRKNGYLQRAEEMEGVIDKEDGCIRRFLVLLDNVEKKVEHLACDDRPPFNREQFLTDRELSEILKISRRCLQDYRGQGRTPYIQLGGKILHRQSDVEKLLEENYHPALA